MMNKSIGGYFELELNNLNSVFHDNAIVLNSGRNALEYILKAKAIQKIYIPYFTCDVLLEPLLKLKIPYEFYSINEQLEPIFDFSVLEDKDCFLYTNYFGLKDSYIRQLSLVCEQLVVDNAQAFYSKSYNNKPTFYSPRKFFGVPDGAYLYCDDKLKEVLEIDVSHNRMSHLLIRKDISAEAGYSNFVANDLSLKNQPIKMMSTLTKHILRTIEYGTVAKKRIENYRFLDNALKSSNKLTVQLSLESVPMVYPYWSNDLNLRKKLVDNKIYTATYWPNVKDRCKEDSLEYRFTNEIVYLPIDQRYGELELMLIIKIIENGNL
jgi:hypothetical protein